MLFPRYTIRRKSPRLWITVPVILRNAGSSIDGLSINVSDGGIYFFAAANLDVGTSVEVEFCPPGSKEPVRAFGTVRRRALYLYAIEFLRDGSSESLSCTGIQKEKPTPSKSVNLERGPAQEA